MPNESSPPVCRTMSCRSPMPALDRSSSFVTWSFHDTPIVSSSVEHIEHPVCLVSCPPRFTGIDGRQDDH